MTDKSEMEKDFDLFMKEYLENIKKKIKWSQRAKQLFNGGLEAELVLNTETTLLLEPFCKAYKKALKTKKEVKK